MWSEVTVCGLTEIRILFKVKVKISQLCLTLCDPMDCSAWNSPGQNTGGGSLSLLQGIFPTQGSNPGLLHCKWNLCLLSHKGSPMFTMFTSKLNYEVNYVYLYNKNYQAVFQSACLLSLSPAMSSWCSASLLVSGPISFCFCFCFVFFLITRYVVVFHCYFDFKFPNEKWCWLVFHRFIWPMNFWGWSVCTNIPYY